jgi:hypothetical protein
MFDNYTSMVIQNGLDRKYDIFKSTGGGHRPFLQSVFYRSATAPRAK